MHTQTHLRGRDDGECVHDSVWELLTNLGYKEGTHAGASATTKGVCQLEALQTIALLSLFADYIQYGVNQLSAFCVVSLGPVVTSTTLT